MHCFYCYSTLTVEAKSVLDVDTRRLVTTCAACAAQPGRIIVENAPSKITIQIAAEAVINLPHAFSRADVEIVLADSVAAGVSEHYTDYLRETLASGLYTEF